MTVTAINLRDYQVSRWRKLAEQRLEHIDELFVSGRWRRYFSERDFLEVVRQAKDTVALWRRLDVRPLETPMPQRPSPPLVPGAETPAASSVVRQPGSIGPLAANLKLDKFLVEPQRASLPAAVDMRPAARLPSPFEDTVGAMTLERAARL